jgi:acetyl esterase/lipase
MIPSGSAQTRLRRVLDVIGAPGRHQRTVLPRFTRQALVALLVLLGPFGVPAAGAAGSLTSSDEQHAAAVRAADLPLVTPKPTRPVIPPVAAPAIVDPGRAVRGTMIMVHAGGWAGHDEYAQDLLVKRPGHQLLALGWRIVSLDYEEGTAGLQDVLTMAGSELARRTGNGPVCIYGESAGGHLALLAASRLRAIDCVVALGPPMDLSLYQQEAGASADGRLKLVAFQMTRFFGTTDAEKAPWDPASLAPRIHSDVLLFRENDDAVVSAEHNLGFAANRITTQSVHLPAGSGPNDGFVHGTVSTAGREIYSSAIAAFAERAVASRRAEFNAGRLGCRSANRTVRELAMDKVRAALRCLARKDKAIPARSGSWKKTSFRVAGELNAARIWARLRSTISGRNALSAAARRRAKLTVRVAGRSRVVLSKR